MNEFDISKAIRSKGYSVKQVAEALNLNYKGFLQTINNNPTISTLIKIADVIGCDFRELLQAPVPKQETSVLVCPHCGAKLIITECENE